MTPGQTEMIKDLEDLLSRAKAWDFIVSNQKDKKPIFAFRDRLAELNAKAIHGKYIS